MSETKNQLPTILLTSFFTVLFLLALFAGGAYWLVTRTTDIAPINAPISSPGNSIAPPTPRAKSASPISVSEITKVQLTESNARSHSSAAHFLGNVNPNDFTVRTSVISFSADGKAVKVIGESGMLNGVQVSPTPQQYTGAVTREKFAELAQTLIENDFLGEEDSKTSTSLPATRVLGISYPAGVKTIQMSNTGNDTLEAEAMIRAFRDLENSVVWKKE
jgi:hypothetical protein